MRYVEKASSPIFNNSWILRRTCQTLVLVRRIGRSVATQLDEPRQRRWCIRSVIQVHDRELEVDDEVRTMNFIAHTVVVAHVDAMFLETDELFVHVVHRNERGVDRIMSLGGDGTLKVCMRKIRVRQQENIYFCAWQRV